MGLPDAGVVDQHVDASEPAGRGVDHRLRGVGVGEVGADDDVAVARQRVRHLLGPCGVGAVVHGDAVAAPRERLRDGGADPAGGAGHEHGATGLGHAGGAGRVAGPP